MASEAQRLCEEQKEYGAQIAVKNTQRSIHKNWNNEQATFIEVVEPQPRFTEESSIDNPISIDLTDEVMEKSIWEDLAFIARIIGPKQPRKCITPWVEKNWGSQVVVKYLPKGFFVIIFADKEERDKALNAKNWYFEKFPLYIQPWTPNFNPLNLAIYESPVWIRLFNLPIEYWGDPCLEKIGRSLGTLLELDEGIIENDSYVYARMRIAAVKQIPSCLDLITANGIWKKNIEIEKDLKECQRCGSRSHPTKKCRIYVRRAKNKIQKDEKMVARPRMTQEDLMTQSKDYIHTEPIPQPCLKDSELDNQEQEDTTNPGMTHPVEIPTANENDDCNIESDTSNSEPEDDGDTIDILDPRCISQSTNALLGRAKGGKGRKSNRQIREEKANEKGIVSVRDFIKSSKGGNPSLGKR
ncbi:hypothetical protein SUGI_0142910 [Cryptomeria japonica]|nr:hypothetical protein SUGI_0142910 [Cryptomeria japonica]